MKYNEQKYKQVLFIIGTILFLGLGVLGSITIIPIFLLVVTPKYIFIIYKNNMINFLSNTNKQEILKDLGSNLFELFYEFIVNDYDIFNITYNLTNYLLFVFLGILFLGEILFFLILDVLWSTIESSPTEKIMNAIHPKVNYLNVMNVKISKNILQERLKVFNKLCLKRLYQVITSIKTN